MYIQCNRIELYVVNLDSIDIVYDSVLISGLENKNSIIISSDEDRINLYKNELSFVHIWNDFFNDDYILTRDLKQILNEQGTNPYECVYLTGDKEEIEQAHKKNLSVLLINTINQGENRHVIPDFVADDKEELRLIFEGESTGYFNEVHFTSEMKTSFLRNFKMNHLINDGVVADLIVGGRFFVDGDPRRYIHPLTQAIINLKYGNERIKDSFAKLLFANFKVVEENLTQINTITAVPPKPSGADMFSELFNNDYLDQYSSKLDLSILKTKEDYKPQKLAGNFTNRALNVMNKFTPLKNVKGHIVLVDDVVTSGSTTMECARALYKAGAERVTIICFGAQQSNSKGIQLESLTCDCGQSLKIRFNYDNGQAFWGCTNYPECKNTMPYNRGKVVYNEKLDIDDINNDDFWMTF